MAIFSIEEEEVEYNFEDAPGARIVAIGVGGGGGNMINHMVREGIEGIELAVANTDAQVLKTSLAPIKIQLGTKLTKGLGAGMQPGVGKESAEESHDQIKKFLSGADIIFVAAGLGGGTGTGAAPVIARIAKEIGALTIAVVTKPFKFERRKRMKLAEAGLNELKQETDSLIIIPNEKLLSIVDKNLGIKDSFRIVDQVLSRAVNGTSGVILSHGDDDINLDFADLKTVMSHRGMALMGVGEHHGQNAAYESIKNAIESPLLDEVTIDGAMGILVNFSLHPSYPLNELHSAMDIIDESVHEDADVFFGTVTDETLEPDTVSVTIIATGFEKELNKSRHPSFDDNVPGDAHNNTDSFIIPERKPKLKVVGGDIRDEVLDVPTFLRNQQD